MSAQNGEIRKDDKSSGRQPASQTEIYGEAVQPASSDEFLGDNNLGLGNYTESTYWQQIDSYQQGMYGDAAFARAIVARAIAQTKRRIAEPAWEQLSGDEQFYTDKREWLDAKGDELWQQLEPHQRRALLKKYTGIDSDWRPPFWRMLMARHEASRSIGARLIDNLFGRIKEEERTVKTPDDGGGLLRSGGGRRDRRGGARR
jgi:hypothetical protein